MKRILLAASLLFALASQAQNLKPMAYKPSSSVGKTTNTNMTMNLEMMGQSMEIVNTTSSKAEYKISDNGNGGLADYRVLNMKVKSSGMMGQEIEMDSDNPGDGPGAEAMANLKNQVIKLTFNKFGVVTEVVKPKDGAGADPGAQMMNMMGGGMSGGEAFAPNKSLEYLTPIAGRERKPGDVWMDSVVTETLRVMNTYSYQGTANDSSLIDVSSTMQINQKTEQNGMEIIVTITGVSKGVMAVDPARGVVLRRTINADMKGTMEMMGNSAPISMKMATTDQFAY